MKMSDIKEVDECLKDRANKLLKSDWEIIKLVKMQNNNEEKILYVMGKS